MPFIIDVDLVRLDPTLFLDAQSVGTELESGGDGQILGSALSSQSSDFITRGLVTGSVVVAGGEAYEVVSVDDSKTLTVSRPRADDADGIIPPTIGTGLSFTVITFARVIDQVEAWALGRLGFDLSDAESGFDESAVLNPAPLARLLSRCAARRIFEIASSRTPTDDSLAQRAALYQSLTGEAAGQTEVQLDLDGDGVVDATRRFDVLTVIRS